MEDLFNIASLRKDRNILSLQHVAQTDGLDSQCILKLVDAVGSKKLRLSRKLALMRCIIPKHSIPEDALLRMTLYLTDFKLESVLKVEILKWIIAAVPFVEDPQLTKFLCLYETFLILLKQEVLRPYVIYLLNLVSTKNHITMNRLKFIMKLRDEHDSEQFTCFNFLLSRLSKLLPKLASETLDLQHSSGEILDIYPQLESEMAAYKSTLIFSPKCASSFKKNACIPINSEDSKSESLDSFHLEVEKTYADRAISVSVHGSFVEIYRNILSLKEMSNENILNSNLRRLLLTSDIALNAQISFFDYLLTSFWCSSCDFNSTLPVILEALREMQVPTVAVSDFIKEIIDVWDGYSNFHAMLEILSYHHMCCFDGKVAYTLDPLLQMIEMSDVIHKCHFLHCFTTIYQNWALFEFSDSDYVICEESCSSVEDVDNPFGNQRYHLSVNECYKFGSYVDSLCDDLLSNNNFHPCLLHQVLLHYQKISAAHVESDLVLRLPTTAVFISSLFSLNSFTLENLCQLMLWFYTEIYSTTKKSHPENDLAKKHFKSCFFDLGNILWGVRDYTPKDHTYLSRTAVFKKFYKYYPEFIKQFVVFMHPALLINTSRFCDTFSITPLSIRHIPEIRHFFTDLFEDGLKNSSYIIEIFHTQYVGKKR